jgi:prepilin-type N-terminal cleavage/methylation domain-containing protein/prepilin-type processing-associated H-X9-DG protein
LRGGFSFYFLHDKRDDSWFTHVGMKPRRTNAFTLVEMIVVVGIISLLAVLSFPVYTAAIRHANCIRCVSNMHTLATSFLSYAYDNDGLLPQRVVTGSKWPTLLLPYVNNDPSVYVDPGDPVAAKIPLSQLISDDPNNSSFIFNGFNDLGADANPNVEVDISKVPSSTILLAEQDPGGDNFYLDVNEGDQVAVLNKTAYFGGANYAFPDGSVRWMSSTQYNDSMWLVNPAYQIPAAH